MVHEQDKTLENNTSLLRATYQLSFDCLRRDHQHVTGADDPASRERLIDRSGPPHQWPGGLKSRTFRCPGGRYPLGHVMEEPLDIRSVVPNGHFRLKLGLWARGVERSFGYSST